MAARLASWEATCAATVTAISEGETMCCCCPAPAAIGRDKSSANAGDIPITNNISGNTRTCRAVRIGLSSIEKRPRVIKQSRYRCARRTERLRLTARRSHRIATEGAMKLIGAAIGLAAMCAIGASAQTQTTRSETKKKIEVKDGKQVTVSGCLERNPGGGYMLTSSASGGMKYALVTEQDLSKHVGERVEVKGKAADKGDAKVKIESKVA